jgi:phosphoribosylglycinamide formyltransferase-1
MAGDQTPSGNAGAAFVCEPIVPVPGSGDSAGASRGEPGLPHAFDWQGRRYRLAGVVRAWKTSGPCRHGSGEMYLRRHWYRVLTDPPAIMTLYCDRQARTPGRPKARWWLYTIEPAQGPPGPVSAQPS